MNSLCLEDIPTMNKMGYASQVLDEYGYLFLGCIHQLSSPKVLDIGAGYGLTTLPALSAGAVVVANDLAQIHLDIIRGKASPDFVDKLSLCAGRFPQELKFKQNSFDVIGMFQVLHFLRAEEIENGLPLLLSWLKPGGKLFLTSITPYIRTLKNFLPIYQKRKQEKQIWPGQVEEVKNYCNHPSMEANPDFIHLLEPDILECSFVKAGFCIEQVGFYPSYPDIHVDYEHTESEYDVGIIASKPL